MAARPGRSALSRARLGLTKPGRLQAVDVYRGLSVVAMAAYHAGWDLNYYGMIEAGIGTDPLWVLAQRTILGAFLVLAGASLTLAHGDGIRWPGFWRREAILVGAALLVSIGTWFALGEYFAYFGVLHAIALFSLMALPFVRWPLWAGILVAIVVLFVPAVYQSDLFDAKWLDWIGFGKAIPETADLVPIFPWFGAMLAGVIGMRLWRAAPAFRWESNARGVRSLAFLGRWSLLFYLVHQPILFGIIMPISNYLNTTEQAKLASFTQSCTAQCLPGHDSRFCTAYCGCALQMTIDGDLWGAINAAPRSASQQRSVESMTKLCTEFAK
jgi:uncharacterized membrane protein